MNLFYFLCLTILFSNLKYVFFIYLINLTNRQSAFEPRDCPIYSHVHLTMLAWFPIYISNELNNDGAISK